MITVIPRRYDAPKWQASVPIGQAFRFANGLEVHNLFELKQALTSVPDNILESHVNLQRHDIADWIRFSVGDISLADAIKTNSHRWGMIVTLERQMMRTLNLPPYVAARWLSPSSQAFTLNDGSTVTSLPELKDALNRVSDEVIAAHCQRVPNDIAKWVNDSIGDYLLADLLVDLNHRSQMLHDLEDHLTMLHSAAN